MAIQLLDQNTINQIAAGEVIANIGGGVVVAAPVAPAPAAAPAKNAYSWE